jgi:hypothetical protein
VQLAIGRINNGHQQRRHQSADDGEPITGEPDDPQNVRGFAEDPVKIVGVVVGDIAVSSQDGPDGRFRQLQGHGATAANRGRP